MADIETVLRAAAEAVERAGIPDDLRVMAFSKAVDAMTDAGGRESARGGEGPGASARDEGSLLAVIAKELGLTLDEISEIFRIDEGEVVLEFPGSYLPDSLKHAQQNIALLLSVGRQVSGSEEVTEFAAIRQACDTYGVKDGNFSTNMKAMDGVLSRRQGGKAAKVRKAGFTQATQLIREFLNGGTQ